MSEPKLYGIERANGTVSQLRFDIDEDADQLAPYATERIVEIVAVKKDRLRALESLVRAADRMREGVESAINSYRRHELDGWEIAVVSTRMQDYDTQRAAVGEIEGD